MSLKLSKNGEAIEIDISGSGEPGMSPEAVDAWLEKSREGFSEPQIHAAFSAVCDKANWKMPIDAIIDRKDREITEISIRWNTATHADFHEVADQPDKLRVTAPGYYNGPCN